MKEGSALFAALVLTAVIAYWSDHFRAPDGREVPAAEEPFPHQRNVPQPVAAPPVAQLGAERLEVESTAKPEEKAGLCVELLDVIHDVDAALLHPQSPASAEQLINRRKAYLEKRAALGC